MVLKSVQNSMEGQARWRQLVLTCESWPTLASEAVDFIHAGSTILTGFSLAVIYRMLTFRSSVSRITNASKVVY